MMDFAIATQTMLVSNVLRKVKNLIKIFLNYFYSAVPGWYNTDDVCDDLVSRVDSLMNISPDQYNGDDDEFPRKTGDSIGSGTPAYGSNPTKWISIIPN